MNISTPVIDGLVPDHWYYKYLDQKGKRPDYDLINKLSVGVFLSKIADKDGCIEGNFEIEEGKSGSIILEKELQNKFQKDLDECNDTIQIFQNILYYITDYSKDELRFLAVHLIGYLMKQYIYSLNPVGDLTEEEYAKKYCQNYDTAEIDINFLKLSKAFNETPQRIRKAIDILARLGFIKDKSKTFITLNLEFLSEALCGIEEAKDSSKPTQLKINNTL